MGPLAPIQTLPYSLNDTSFYQFCRSKLLSQVVTEQGNNGWYICECSFSQSDISTLII